VPFTLVHAGKYRKKGKLKIQAQHRKANNAKHIKTKLPWFSHLLRYSARKQGGLILQCSREHKAPWQCIDHSLTLTQQPHIALTHTGNRHNFEVSYHLHINYAQRLSSKCFQLCISFSVIQWHYAH